MSKSKVRWNATTEDGRYIVVPENVIMELKFPDQNIIGVVV